MMVRKRLLLRRETTLALLSLAFAATGLAETAAPAAYAAPATEARAPGALVRQFYDWYLAEQRAGQQPFADEARMRAYFTEAQIAEMRANALPDFDPVLLLPRSGANRDRVKVLIGATAFHHRQGFHDAYVDVVYAGQGDHWSIGLDRTPAGWRIVSIALAD